MALVLISAARFYTAHCLNVAGFSKSEYCLEEFYTYPETPQASFVLALKTSTVFDGPCLSMIATSG